MPSEQPIDGLPPEPPELSYSDMAARVAVLEKALLEAHDDLCHASWNIRRGPGAKAVNEAIDRAKKAMGK